MIPTHAQGVSGSLRSILKDGRPLADVFLPVQISLDLIRQVMDHYYDAIDNWRQSAQGPIQNWPTLDGKEGFGGLQRMRPQSRPQPGS